MVPNYKNEDFGKSRPARARGPSNTVFAQVAVQEGAAALVSKAEAFGFNTTDEGQDFSVATSTIPDANDMSEWETAWAGDGQPVGEHASGNGPVATVMQLAMIAGGISNGGIVMNPYVIDHVLSSEGTVTTTTQPEVYSQACDASTASTVYTAMKGVIENGTASAAAVDGVEVVGKTGTAQTSDSTDNAVFIGSGRVNGKTVAVAIVIENTQAGAATPKAGELIKTSLTALGAL